ncbi:MAG: insulinase family protein [Prevotella sp.]|uniref:M16 family metallopeptidase n=1 Tax=Prevotella sp. TaxID=59823 RepID=UPI002A291FDA|nr:insulinase family protein [Prevotella sp.]MDD7317824.1 insulinase family protein [Prevotellaceae bacterium]MDY4020739.1 insulinase family protein [Prevotella sp.]
MRKTLTLLLLLLCITAGAKDYKYRTVDGDLLKTRIYTLDNGLQIYLSVNKEKPRIQTFIAVRTGSKNDPAETTGLAHYLEHIMFKGTKQFGTSDAQTESIYLDQIENLYEEYRNITDPQLRRQKYHEIDSMSQIAAGYFIPNEYDKLMSTIGAQGTNAYTSFDVTCYTEDIPSNEIDNWAKIQSDRFMNMVIRGFHTELEAVYEEYNIGLAQDTRKMFNALAAKLFPGHPYGTQTTIGTQAHLKNPSITNIKRYFDKWYRPNNVAICMAGDFNPDEVVAIIDKYFGKWEPGKDVVQPDFGTLKELTQPSDTTVLGKEAANMWLGWRFGKGASLQSDTLNVISHLLGNGTAGLIDLDLNQSMKVIDAWADTQILMDGSAFIMGGTPKEGQQLTEVRDLLLGEIEKLKRGEFSEELLEAVKNNMKLDFYTQLEFNRSRADMYVDAFIQGRPWEVEVGRMDRMAGITKQQIVDFCNRHFKQNYVAVYKEEGEDPNITPVDKPAITEIPTNRDMVSQFVSDIKASKVEPIQPRFVDFNRDLSLGKTKKNLPYIYVQNTENGRFEMGYFFNIGDENDPRYSYAARYLQLVGTDKMTAEEVKQKFYNLACEFNVGIGRSDMKINLGGLNDNMPKAVALLEDLIMNARADKEVWNQFVEQEAKKRADNKKDQRANYSALRNYAMFGEYNPVRNDLSIEELRNTDPQALLDMLKQLMKYEHTLLYYGPSSKESLAAVIDKNHKTGKKLMPVPEGKRYEYQTTPGNEVFIAPYEAQNIYMMMYHNDNRTWNEDELAVSSVFDEYFGGGMNSIVFQELREARGLAYSAGASYSLPYRKGDPEYFTTSIITQNDKMMDCINQFNAILDTIPQSESAFNIAKDALKKRLESRRVTKYALINNYLSNKILGIDYDRSERIYNGLDKLTMQDIVDYEKRLVANKTYRYVILGDEKSLNMDAISKMGPVKRLSTETIFGY